MPSGVREPVVVTDGEVAQRVRRKRPALGDSHCRRGYALAVVPAAAVPVDPNSAPRTSTSATAYLRRPVSPPRLLSRAQPVDRLASPWHVQRGDVWIRL